jgi:hypothetical protein
MTAAELVALYAATHCTETADAFHDEFMKALDARYREVLAAIPVDSIVARC